ncbi:hypothetical protein HXX76_006426 [Chlamydomonas incerta]|uniref:Uncharacterized protein n=1 Tax=Chlamydomonas incerta TaxID=51695 RepID=A0A835T4J9_CHLIN|nr:hypothetical protein HXX76_006426 [Chlamydomonas incerta]|eukprot:KAG2436907.1 hypothetical protein HXX76_006426 [Chlamydomonas incerta]
MESFFAFSSRDSIWTPPVLSHSGSLPSSPSWWTRSPSSSSSGPGSPVNGTSSKVKTVPDASPRLLDSASWRLSRWCAWAEDAEWAEVAAKAARLQRVAQTQQTASSNTEQDVDVGDTAVILSCVECLGL